MVTATHIIKWDNMKRTVLECFFPLNSTGAEDVAHSRTLKPQYKEEYYMHIP